MKKQKHTVDTEEMKNHATSAESSENTNQNAEIAMENQDEHLTNTQTDDTANFQQQIDELAQKCEEINDKNLRLMAEFDNFRKRSMKERTELIKSAGESILVNILPLVDDFERAHKAMETSEDVQAVKQGVELIYNKFISFLLQNGVKAISTENEDFNTDLHEAITTLPAPTEDLKGKIVDCVSKGYTLNDKVIRFSKVVVGE
ncbi:MAG: nucleotide exchange factor GrpE [Porphyromonadaceae bacterium CG2_30_38_12]|nr:MAG: nucleotide exchange factor GrpE [Porphyromonadaceae bacterium CG2_30_38_12]